MSTRDRVSTRDKEKIWRRGGESVKSERERDRERDWSEMAEKRDYFVQNLILHLQHHVKVHSLHFLL